MRKQLRHVSTTRLWYGAITFFVLFVSGCLLYSWLVKHDADREVAETPDGTTPVGTNYRPFHTPYYRMVDGFTVTPNFALQMAPYDIGPQWAAMSAEELAAAIDTINESPGAPRETALWPPEGYFYPYSGSSVLANGENVWLDDNGFPILLKRGAPRFDVHWSDDFRPPPDVYPDYKALVDLYLEAHENLPLGATTSPEMVQLSAEIDAMEEKYVGRIPVGIFSGRVRPSGTRLAQGLRQYNAVEIQLWRTAYESEGIAYLMDMYPHLKEFAK